MLLGVVKRQLLEYWFGIHKTKNPHLRQTRKRPLQKGTVSERIEDLSAQMPRSLFHRVPTGLDRMYRYKAHEIRTLLIYQLKYVLRDILTGAEYKHFMSLVMAMSILLTADNVSKPGMLEKSLKLLRYFVDQGCIIYSDRFLTYNCHGLQHLPADAKRFGSIEAISAFPFENFLGMLKGLPRSGYKVVEQIVNRLNERQGCARPENMTKATVNLKKKENKVQLRDGNFAEVISKRENGTLDCLVYEIDPDSDFFSFPELKLESKDLGTFVLRPDPIPRNISSRNIFKKALILKTHDGIYGQTFLSEHTLHLFE